MKNKKETKFIHQEWNSGGFFFTVLALIFITLKLIGIIEWSWWWVLAPLWGPLAFVLFILLCYMVCIGIKRGLGW